MQQPSLFYFNHGGMFNQDSGGAGQIQGWIPEGTKPNQFQSQWENNGGFHVTTGNNYGQGQAQGGGGQNRVVNSLGPQQPQQPAQPPPVSTPPSVHGDMSKQTVMQNQQGAQFNLVQRPMNPNFGGFSRSGMQQPPQIRGRAQIVNYSHVNNMSIPGVLATAPTPAIVQAYPTTIMYGPQRQGTSYSGQGQYLVQQPYFNAHPSPQYYHQPVIPQAFQGMPSGGPSPQAGGQQTQVPLVRPNLVPTATVSHPIKAETKKRPNAIKIIDPITNEEVQVDSGTSGNNNNITPTRSNDSSARETPQPSAGVEANTVAADFAARVAVKALELEPPTPPVPPPEHVQEDSLPETISDSEIHHKQLPVPSSGIIITTLSSSSQEFIPMSQKQAQQCETPVLEESRTPVVPTVSAETNSPAIDIQRPKDFPALKNTVMPSGPGNQSPMRGNNSKKQKSTENERQQVAAVPASVSISTPLIDNNDNAPNKKGPKNVQKEENVPLPKEKRERKAVQPGPSPVITQETMPSQPDVVSISVAKSTTATAGTLVKDVAKSNNVVIPVVEPVEEQPPVIPLNNRIIQHQNGETGLQESSPPVAVESNKSARQKKKGGKKAEYNRKGGEKEGSEMDAFTTDTVIVSEETERPLTPVTSLPPSQISTTPTPPPTIEPAEPLSPIDKIKEDMAEKEDRLTAARNEENIKVSALIKAEEEPAPVIVEKPVPQLTLKHSYKEDQWSPLNPEGKKKYEREFLIGLKGEPQSNLKPENLPDVVAVISNSGMRNTNIPYMNNRDISGIIPTFMQRNSQSQKGPLPKRGSQQGNKGKGNPKVIHVSLSLQEDVKLRTAENAWKPNRLVYPIDKSEEEKQTEELYKNVRGILNKLTPQKFDTLMKRFTALPINSEERLNGVIKLIFEKAVDEPNFSKAYANMCKLCSKMEVSKVENGQETKVNFRKILITRCQTEFESSKPAELDAVKHQEEIRNCTDPEQKKELQIAYEEKERILRMKSVGNIRFIGELYKMGMLTQAIMYRCIEHLLSNPEEESLECLCKLLTTIGKDLEFPTNQKPSPQSLNPYFQKMSELAQKRDSSKVSSRVRFMLQDVIDLRQKKWIPRRDDNNPKTIDQITKEAEKEQMDISIALSQQPPRMANRQNDRQDKRDRGGRGNNQNDDGWVNVGGNSRHYNKFTPAFEASKMQIKTDAVDLNSLSLGGSSQFRFGMNTSKQPTEVKTGAPFVSSNLFSALSRGGDERKPPYQPNNMNRRITPTTSIERDKERQRMIQGAMEAGDGRGSRGNSAQRDRPQPPSRDSSVPRQPPVDNKELTEAVAKGKQDDEKHVRITDDKSARLAQEKLERQTNTIFDEYLAGFSTVNDIRQDIEQMYPSDKVGDFVQRALEISLEKKAGTQKSIGELLTALMDYNLFSSDVLVKQLSFIYEMADDMAIDIPKVWELQAHIIVPILVAEKINFSHFKSACSSVLKTRAASKLLIPVFNLLEVEKGAGFVRKVWDSSNVSLKDFLPNDNNVDAFIKENSLEYLTGDPPKYDSCSSMDEVQEKLLRLMQSNQPYEQILNFISSNVGGKMEDLQFIRALVTSVCEACITGSTNNLDTSRFKQYEKLIQRYVDNKEDRELASLNSVHILLSRLQHPQGLIKAFFNLFWEDNLISYESFQKWKDSDQEKLENKGVSLFALASFFSALEEVETDDENS